MQFGREFFNKTLQNWKDFNVNLPQVFTIK